MGRLALAALQPRQRASRRSSAILQLTDEERDGLSAPDRFRVDITPYFISLIDPDDPDDPIRRQVIPLGREQQAFTAMMEDSLAEDRHSPVPGPGPSLPRPGADAHHHPVRQLLPLLHPVADRGRPDPELQPPGARGAAGVPAPDAPGARRAHQRWRRPDARAQAAGVDPAGPARDPPHRDRAHRLAGARVPAPAHRRRAVRDAPALPPAVDEPALQPPRRDHAGGLAGGRPADPRGHPRGQPVVLLAGVNDCVHIQRALVHKLVANRIRPYYLYQCDLVEGSGHFRTPVGKGLEIIEGLRGHTSGYAVPTYVIDAPGGGGKIPVMPNYLISYSDHKVVLRNYEGYITTYEEPETYQRHDTRRCRVLPAPAARSPARAASTACSRATGCGSSRAASRRSTPAATPTRTGSRTRPSGCPRAWVPSRARRPADARAAGAGGRRMRRRDLRARRGAPASRGRAHRVRPRRAAVAAAPTGAPPVRALTR